MCRWLAYSGSPILLEELLYRPSPSLIDQSLHAQMGAEATNGDGFGVGWYGLDTTTRDMPDTRGPNVPVLFRGIEPAWNDQNLRELARSTSSGLFFAHLRASTGSPVQQTNCHPFRHDRWLWMHNGAIRDFALLKRDLTLAVDPALYPAMEGSTDSEVMFHLAMTFGLTDDPVTAVERMVGFVEATGRRHGVEHPVQMTVATSDGESLWSFRYSSEHQSRTLYVSAEMATLRLLYPDNPAFVGLSEETRVVVSEPVGDFAGAWHPFPESSYGIVQPGNDVMGDFRPRDP
ncbi:class II glutamine amidotransferase [Aeromicrobium wangtongii]|uniref:Class II glutamine amidotransferase n=1 Tax=Aeromicrobium wangtongii TaxID=2969247 RepID=A0ABY5MFD1_9ACTN|nr:class II glutamine amidotransferase [Aeromicrobium wangtongii]MCD9197955.1 class II glutamine amidotransferase [Aeromicrobium wangtongii]UUP15433.1 class II glutamine amidotransferase [Aeromicrobium wangtongii]